MTASRAEAAKSGAALDDRLLTPRELNRATLARQLLLDRTIGQSHSVLRGLVAMQGQVSNAPYIGLWTRIRDFDPTTLTRMIQNRQVVRAPFVRGTLHLLSATDYLLMQPVLRSALGASLRRFSARTPDFDEEGVLLTIASYLREREGPAGLVRAFEDGGVGRWGARQADPLPR